MRATLILLCLFILSCENNYEPKVKVVDQPTTLVEVFDSFWSQMQSKYVFWDIDPTDWDDIYIQYRPLFEPLKIDKKEDVLKANEYFKSMTQHLIDGHLQLTFNHPSLDVIQDFNPVLSIKQQATTYRSPYDFQDIASTYLDTNFSKALDFESSGIRTKLSTLCGTINQQILYFSCNAFFLQNAVTKHTSNKAVIEQFLAQIPSATGIIIDLRGNYGGQISDLNFFIGHFIDQPMHYGYSKTKYGKEYYAYTDWLKAFINPKSSNTSFTNPVVVLIDNKTASTAELATIALRQLPNVTLLGEQTYGATGPVTREEVYNTGSFSVEGFMKVRASSTAFSDLAYKNYENQGIAPDIHIPFNLSAIQQGKDLQLEKAISLLD